MCQSNTVNCPPILVPLDALTVDGRFLVMSPICLLSMPANHIQQHLVCVLMSSLGQRLWISLMSPHSVRFPSCSQQAAR